MYRMARTERSCLVYSILDVFKMNRMPAKEVLLSGDGCKTAAESYISESVKSQPNIKYQYIK
jgi:hypothetical protein